MTASGAPAAATHSRHKAHSKATHDRALRSDVREVKPGAQFSTRNLELNTAKPSQAAAGVTPPVGTVRTLLALDDFNGILYRKQYTLMAVGAKIEVWVANDTAFPAGDCRTQVAGTTTVTQAQAQALADQFDTNMFPKESAAFSVPPDRDGSGNVVSGVDPTGDGDKIMTLVDNVRDDNYYLGVNQAPTYIAGFFSSQFNELLDRNIMTIDAYDWAHRTGANPPDNPTGDPCTSRAARPRLYEGTFAHEYQHLLEYYQDPAERSWVNEGLSDYAISLTGYGDASRTVFQQGAQSHIYCYQGFGIVQTPFNPNPIDCGGPENSLTLWGDQPPASAILADYGEAWSFMLFLRDRYGPGLISSLHRDGADQGLLGVQHQLDGYAPGTDVYDVLHDFQTMTLVDQVLGNHGKSTGIKRGRITTESLNSTVNLGNPSSYARDGAPANGADYVGLRAGSGLYLDGEDLRNLSFTGAKTLVPEPLKWTVVASPPLQAGDPALWSGNTSNLDASAATQVTVPAASPTLTFNELHLAEQGFDYAYTEVSTDGGKTYHALANANTVDGPLGPALNGDAAGWATQTFDLSAYAGRSVIIAFRYVSDGGVNEGGWYVDDVSVGGTAVNDGTTTAPFQSKTQIRPIQVHAWNVRIVGVDTDRHRVRVIDLPGRTSRLDAGQVNKLHSYPRIVAIVAYDEPTEQYQPQALYTLKVNGVVQPGGGQSGAAVKARPDQF
jgi:Immune inhibitor A peptidase M6